MEQEGVIKFDLRFTPAAPLSFDQLRVLDAWRTILYRLGLIGQDALRYGGVGFGNVSQRLNDKNAVQFVITGSQTSELSRLDARHYSVVTEADVARNAISAKGETRPSSEALTHAMIYRARPEARFVFHVHSPAIWRYASELGLPVTDPAAAYGTPAMAQDVERLLASPSSSIPRAFAMGGHEDGIVSYGETAEEAGVPLLTFFASALIAFGSTKSG